MTDRSAADVAKLLEIIFITADEFDTETVKRTSIRTDGDTVVASLTNGQSFTFTIGEVLDARITDDRVEPLVPMPPPPRAKRARKAPAKAPPKKAAPRRRATKAAT